MIYLFATQIEQWCEHHYPSFVSLSGGTGQLTLDMSDVRTRVVEAEKQKMVEKQAQRRSEALRNAQAGPTGPVEEMSTRELVFIAGGGVALVVGLSAAIVWVMITYSA